MVDERNEMIPDLTKGVSLGSLVDGAPRVGYVGNDKVFLVRDGSSARAFGTRCPHLEGPLDEGLIENGVVRCPWHHACFDLRTGEALSAPAFDALTRHSCRVEDGIAIVGEPMASPARATLSGSGGDGPMVIVGGGAAGFAAADSLRKEGWAGDITLISADPREPYDRTLLTKDYLDGQFGDDRLPIARHRLEDLGVHVRLGASVSGIDLKTQTLKLGDGGLQRYERLLLATGAKPRAAPFPGANSPDVHYLRSLDDCRRLLGAIGGVRSAAVVGGSFIGLEAAASLRSRGLEIHVVSPERHPMSKVFGQAVSDLIVESHREKGVVLHLGRNVARIDAGKITLDDGASLDVELTLIGIGVEPCVELAKSAGLRLDRGVLVDPYLRTSAPHVFAAGDIARWPDPHSGQAIRVEHWVVAERQGQIAAANMLGAGKPFEDVPFFWTKHFDLAVLYVGHADEWDELIVEGSVADRDALIRYRKADRDLAVATIGRDMASLEAERDMARRLAESRGEREQT